MANEIRATAGLGIQNGQLSITRTVSNFQADQTTLGMQYGVQGVTFSAAVPLDMGNVVAAGWAFFRNLDDTHFIEIGTNGGGFVPFAKLLPGEPGVIRLATSAPYAKADTAAVDLEYLILED